VPAYWLEQHANGAGRYVSFAEFWTQVVLSERKLYGWVGNEFFELWPGGRCINWTTALPKEKQ
jgi:hypothetical protein